MAAVSKHSNTWCFCACNTMSATITCRVLNWGAAFLKYFPIACTAAHFSGKKAASMKERASDRKGQQGSLARSVAKALGPEPEAEAAEAKAAEAPRRAGWTGIGTCATCA
mmetsp:Transcript_63949/g.128308  ORF Transcript_63949/g.128308 Transcript_63949/m.128308 type:complete len:110 (+) Transcript_63949:898-1227(+)